MFALSFSFGSLIKILWASCGTAILGGVGALVLKGLKLLHINISTAQQKQLTTIVEDAISYAEEQDAAAKKNGGMGFSSKAKLQIATKYVLDHKLSDVTPEQISALIVAILPQLGLGASGK